MCRSVTRKPLFVDLNAVAPETVLGFDAKLRAAGIDLVDGGILGGPPKEGMLLFYFILYYLFFVAPNREQVRKKYCNHKIAVILL
jgi:hypothetical protein